MKEYRKEWVRHVVSPHENDKSRNGGNDGSVWILGLWKRLLLCFLCVGGMGGISFPAMAQDDSFKELLKKEAELFQKETTSKPASRPTTRPGESDNPFRPAPWERRQRRRRIPIRRVLPVLPQPQTMSVSALIDDLKNPDWLRQSLLIEELYRRGKSVQDALYQAFQTHKHLRVRLLAAMTLGRFRDPRPIPVLLRWSEEWFDHPNPTLTGVWLVYGKLARSAMRKAVVSAARPHHLVTTLSLWRDPAILPILRNWLVQEDDAKQQIARQALAQFDDDTILQQIEMILALKVSAIRRSTLYRIAMFCERPKALLLMIRGLQDADGAIQFLVRLSLQDKAEQLYKTLPKILSLPPQGEARRDSKAWMMWWQRNERAITEWYMQHHHKDLSAIPVNNVQRVLLLYRTLHPMFGYGRMPILVHDERWKNPPAPVSGKVWNIPLPPQEFAQLVQQATRLQFFQWPQQMGNLRDITVLYHGKSRRVRMGMIRHLPFEQWEQEFIQLSRKAKVYLHFEDYYRRKDESAVMHDNQVGQWAFRTADQMVLDSWSTPATWKPQADIEGLFGVLGDISQYLPSRTRLNALDIWGQQLRFFGLLFGSRSQSTYTRDELSKSRRIRNFQMQGIGVIYLMEDKIEQMIFDFNRNLLPLTSRFAPIPTTRLPLFTALAHALDHPEIQVQQLTLSQHAAHSGLPHQLFVRYKARDLHSVRLLLARLAMRSAGDRVLRFRVNPSGQPDRDKFTVIVQMQWEMLDPVAPPTQTPISLIPGQRPSHNMFLPLYR